MVAVIVDEENLDRQLICQDGLQFLQVHHDRAIAFQADGGTAAACNASANGGGQAVTHAGNGAVVGHAADDIVPVDLCACNGNM